MRRPRWLCAVIVATVAVSCSDDDAAGSVRGSKVVTWIHDRGRDDVPVDLGEALVTALVADGTGSYRILAGRGSADGTFEVPGVPAGRYLFCLERTCVDTRERVIDLGSAEGGRPGAVVASSPDTAMHLVLDGLAPIGADDTIQLVAPNAGVSVYHVEDIAEPVVGATSLDATLSWGDVTYPEPRLIDAGSGDVMTVAQLVSTSSGDTVFERLERSVSRDDVAMVDGEPVTVAGSMVEVPLDHTLHADWRRSEFAALGPSVSPEAKEPMPGLFLSALLAAGTDGFYASSADLLKVDYSASEAVLTDVDVALTYGDPYPASWTRLLEATMDFRVDYAVGDMRPAVVFGSVTTRVDAASWGATPLRPVLSPVSSLDVQVVETAGEVRWTLSWTAPSIGTADCYWVSINRLYPGEGRTTFDTVGDGYTTATSVDLPPPLLSPGDPYFVRVVAYSGRDPARPYRDRLPYAEAHALSPMLVR